MASGQLARAARDHGIAILAVGHTFTCGELGAYPRSLAGAGLVSIAVCSSSALMSVGGSPHRVLGTNPLAFAVPLEGQRPIVADQASSQTAFVNIRSAALRHESIPADWAVDELGAPTQDPVRALSGALLLFGGYKGGNTALLVELLVALAGASWGVDAAPFDSGSENPDVGMVVIAIDPSRFDAQYAARVAAFVERLAAALAVSDASLDNATQRIRALLAAQKEEEKARAL